MSEVWLAEDAELDRSVAVKLLAPTADRLRFEREARAYATCTHSNVACVFDYGELEGRPYIVLEHLPGGTLEDRLTEARPLSDTDTREIATQIAAGMAQAHSRGLVHRDLKPANILFDSEGRAKIADFGIAHTIEASTLTEAGTILGTAAYASPEQVTDQPVTPASDVYSFGVILFRMLTGTLPFTARSTMELLLQHAHAEPPPVSRFRADAPPDLVALATASLAKDPDERPSDGGALLEALSPRAERSDATAATEVLHPIRGRPSRRAAVGGAAALAVLVPVGFAAAVLGFGANSSDSTPDPAGNRSRAQQTSTGPQSEPATSSTSAATTQSESTATADEADDRGHPTNGTSPTPSSETTGSATSVGTGATSTLDTTATETTPTTTGATTTAP